MDPDLRGTGSSGSGVLMESSMDAQSALTSQTRVVLPGTRPGQSANRDRTQSWWDVLPAVPKCGKPCFMCGAPCNRTLGKHFIRLADDNPAHCAVSMTYMSSMVSRHGGAWCDAVFPCAGVKLGSRIDSWPL